MKALNITNKKFGRLTALRMTSKRLRGNVVWECVCVCGNKKHSPVDMLLRGQTKSCGCLKEKSILHNTTHGMSKSSEYNAWALMRDRCYNPKSKPFNRYGGRGIAVCRRWRSSFQNFLSDMGKKPNKKLTLDRINNDGPYAPWNCRWATYKQQINNRGVSKWR